MALDLNDIINQLDLTGFIYKNLDLTVLKKGETRWYCTCPFCGNDKKKFTIDISGKKKSVFGCFACGEKGNIISLYAKIRGCSNGEAVKVIKKFAGIKDEEPKPARARKPRKPGAAKVNPPAARQKVKQKDIPTNLSGQSDDGQDQTGGDDIPPWEPQGYENSQEAKHVDPGDDVDLDDVDSAENAGHDGGGPSEVTARGAARPRDVYAELVRVAALTDAHRQELRAKRGFTDATIDRLLFRSGGEYMAGVIEKLRDEFSDEDLKDAGILVDVNGTLVYNRQLLEDRILIPYLDEKGEIYHLRPHKLGFKKVPIQPYCRRFLASLPDEIVLTEGEFKAAALMQLEIPAIAIPGISSFGDKHFDRLVEMLREFEVKKVTIIFDNEVKDNPAFPNYKEKPADRYDTDYWAYLMAWKLGRESFITRVGKLPDEWRINGKIDFDGALAAGHTKAEILKVIDQAHTAQEFLKVLPEDAQRIVQRKLDKQFTYVPIEREFYKYVAVRRKGNETWRETISNFVINIKSSYFTPDGVIRNVQFVNSRGEHSDVFALNPADMAGLNEFKKFCFSKGNYLFEGNTTDLLNVWKYEFLHHIEDMVHIPEKIGRINKNLWLFGNMAIYKGKVYRPDEEGIFWINGIGYKPQPLQLDQKGETSQDTLPTLSESEIDIKEIALKMKHCIGSYGAYLGLGWVVATIFSEDIFNKFRCFPFIFPHGKHQSGKTSFMQWLMAFFGIETEGYNIGESTQVHIVRSLSYYSSLGVWFDEYRNEPKINQKDGYLRSAYNRQISGKGIKQGFGTRGYHVCGTLGITGEVLPKDGGLFSRCVPIQISEYKRDRTWYEWLCSNAPSFSSFTRKLILNYDYYKDKILNNITELRKALIKKGINDRAAGNWAIVAAAFETAIFQDDDFIRWVEENCQLWKVSSEEVSSLNAFFEDINVMLAQGDIDGRHIQAIIDRDNKKLLYLWFNGIHNLWSIYSRKKTGIEPFDKITLLKYLQDEPYYRGYSSNKISFNGARRKGHIIDVESATETIQEIFEIQLEAQRRREAFAYKQSNPYG